MVYTYTQLASTDLAVIIYEHSIKHISEISGKVPIPVDRNSQILRNTGKPGENNAIGARVAA